MGGLSADSEAGVQAMAGLSPRAQTTMADFLVGKDDALARMAFKAPLYAAAERADDQYGKPVAAVSEGVARYFSQKALDNLIFPPSEAPPR